MVGAIGALTFRSLVLPRLSKGWRRSIPIFESHAARVGVWSAATLAAVALPRLWLQARGLVGADEPTWPMTRSVLGTTWGVAWILQTAGALTSVTAFFLARRGRVYGWQLALVALISVVFSAACMGHPVASRRLVWLAVPGDAAHLAAVGAWAGTLFVLARVSYSADLRSEGGGAIAALVQAVHRVALGSAAIVIASGMLSVLLRLRHVRDLFTSDYGTVLLVKLALVGAVICLGAWNSRTVVRRARDGQVPAVMTSIASEVFFAAVTLGVTAILVGTDPPAAAGS